MAITASGLSVSEVTDVDRRTARKMGMDPEKVNLVINTWANEYLTYESEQAKLTAAANPTPAPAKRAPAKAPAKAVRAPRKPAAKAAATPDQSATVESPSEPDTAKEGPAE